MVDRLTVGMRCCPTWKNPAADKQTRSTSTRRINLIHFESRDVKYGSCIKLTMLSHIKLFPNLAFFGSPNKINSRCKYSRAKLFSKKFYLLKTQM